MSVPQPDRQEVEQETYINLVQELLNCPQGGEHDLLAANPDLIDEQLVETMLAIAAVLQEEDGYGQKSTAAEWLKDFALVLAQKLDLGSDRSQRQLQLLLEVLQSIQSSTPGAVYPLLCQNVELLNEGMIEVLEMWVNSTVAEVDEDARQVVAMTISELGNLIQEFPLGNKATNIDLSICCYDLAIQIFTVDKYPWEWTSIQNNLAIAYSERIRGDKAENLEMSITYYGSALKIYTKEHFPREWAMVQNNVANAYLNRIRGDRSHNLEKAICCYDSALKIRTKSDFPTQWAITHNNLANAFSSRIQGDRSENLEKSIICYESALEIYTKSDFPVDWAVTQNNLANTYLNRIDGDRSENLEKSIIGYQLALEVRTKSDSPLEWATTQNNLANAYSERIRGGKADNLELAISCYESALEIYTKYNFPVDWAMAQNNLANVYSARIQGNRFDNLKKSIICYASSLEVRTPQSLPIDCLQSARNLGTAHFNQGNWQKAIDAYGIAMQAAETSRSWSVDETERQRVLETALNVYENAIQCAINLNDYRKAIEYTERVRSRQLVELIASKDLYHDAEVPIEIQEYLREYQQINERVENIRDDGMMIGSVASHDDHVSFININQVEARKQELYLKIRAYDPILAGQITIDSIPYNEIQKLITNAQTAILTFYSTNDDTHIFIIKQNQEPELFTCIGQGWNEFQRWLIENWLKPYQIDNSEWCVQMPIMLAEIADRLQLNRLVENLSLDIQELVLVPHLLLHQIPFAALPISTSLDRQAELLGDKFIIRSIPSCQILQYCQQRPVIKSSIQGIVEDADDSLIGARYECQKIADIYQISDRDRLRGKSQSTIANYRSLLARVNRIHSSHHATSRLDNPLESALFLADGKITLGDLLMGEKYPELDEVFLSACETHLGTFTFTDDVATLTTGFLCMGARSVISTLWNINDLVTALFDIFYHQKRRDGISRALSLQAAQIKLRNLSGEEFRINHYLELKKLVNEILVSIEQQIEELDNTEKEAASEKKLIGYSKIGQLESQYISLTNIRKNLDLYSQQTRPFESPFYWAGFICQGMA